MPQDNTLLPPGADSDKAEKYVAALVDLVSQDKLIVTQTDLSRFNSSSMEDHYRVNLEDYDVELSHNRNSETKEETFIMIFNSISKFDNAEPKPLILSYMHLTSEQYLKLKEVADAQIERNKKKEEEQRFLKTMEPVDALLDQLKTGGSSAPIDPADPPPAQDPPAQTGKPEEFLANAQPISNWNTNLTPDAELQNPDPISPNPSPVEVTPVPEAPQPETPAEQTPEPPAETSADKSELPL